MENIPTQNFESQEDKEDYSSKIELRIFRHGKKEDSKEGQPDEKVHLTKEGKKESMREADDGTVDQSVAYGSPRERSQQTAAYTMAGNMPEITGNESFDELKDKLEGNIEVGSKIGTEDRLNFSDPDLESEYGEWLIEAFKDGRFLSALIKDSDQKAEELQDDEAPTYSTYAANIAQIIDRYIKASSRWDDLVEDSENDYEKELERYLGTHTGVAESFLAKVIEKMEGVDERNEFLKAVGPAGFDFNEGFEIDIINNHGDRRIQIIYSTETENGEVYEFNEIIPSEIITDIANIERIEKDEESQNDKNNEGVEG